MTDVTGTRISNLPDADSVSGPEELALVQDGATVRATMTEAIAFHTGDSDPHTDYQLEAVVNTVADAGAAETLVVGHNRVTLSENCTITMPTVTSGKRVELSVTFVQDGTGGWQLTWPGSVVGSGTTPVPVLATLPNAETELRAWTDDDGTTWYVSGVGQTAPYLWWRNEFDLVVPDSEWTPVPWETVQFDHGGWHEGNTAATTIAVGSDSASLPQSTINVASTTGFDTPTSGDPAFLLIQTSTSPDERTIVRYTGKTATTFTGCTLGSGTLATSDAVTQANVNLDFSLGGDFFDVFVCVAFAVDGTGVRCARWLAHDGVFNLTIFRVDVPAMSAAPDNIQCLPPLAGQPGNGGATGSKDRVEVYQSSGGPLNLPADGIHTPIIMAKRGSHYTV